MAHAALRWVLGRCLGIPAAEVRFREGSFDGNAIYGKSNGRIKPALALIDTRGYAPRILAIIMLAAIPTRILTMGTVTVIPIIMDLAFHSF